MSETGEKLDHTLKAYGRLERRMAGVTRENRALREVVQHVAGLVVQDADGYSKVHRAVIESARAALHTEQETR